MAYIVKAFTPGKLNLAPETLEEEVLQNVAIIVSTPKFSVPLDRGLGLAQRFIDKPIQVAQSILISEVLDAVEEYEPRAEVTNVTFEAGEMPGLLVPVLEVNIVDNEEYNIPRHFLRRNRHGNHREHADTGVRENRRAHAVPGGPGTTVHSVGCRYYRSRAGEHRLFRETEYPTYAEGEYLDSLAELFKGAERLEPEKARTTLQYTLSIPLEVATTIPAGTRATPDGEIVFATLEDLTIPAGQRTGNVEAECQTEGEAETDLSPDKSTSR